MVMISTKSGSFSIDAKGVSGCGEGFEMCYTPLYNLAKSVGNPSPVQKALNSVRVRQMDHCCGIALIHGFAEQLTGVNSEHRKDYFQILCKLARTFDYTRVLINLPVNWVNLTEAALASDFKEVDRFTNRRTGNSIRTYIHSLGNFTDY